MLSHIRVHLFLHHKLDLSSSPLKSSREKIPKSQFTSQQKKGRASIKIYGNNGKYDIYARPLASPPPIYASNNTKSLDLRERK